MRRLTHKDEVCILLSLALMLMYGAAEHDYFYLNTLNLSLPWEQARNHCQVCFKDLVTVTPGNSHWIASNISSASWIGLRKNFYSNFSSTTNFSWTRWANGDPLTFQNWYPGWPVFKSPFPRRDCCSCSCTCPAASAPATPGFTRYTSFTTSNVANFSEHVTYNFSTTDQPVTDVTGPSTDTTDQSVTDVTRNSTNTTDQSVTAEGEVFGECVRSPMLLPDVPDPDELYIEDSCVAMLMFGAWVEKNCSDLLPFICYEEHFVCKAVVGNVTSTSADLTWPAGPDNIDHYRVDVVTEGDRNRTLNRTNTTFNYNLIDLTPGAQYSVQVVPVKCGRDLDTEEVTFNTIPNKVEDLKVLNVTETSVFLSWVKPAGHVKSYLIKVQDNDDITSVTEGKEIDGLTSGRGYIFSVFTEVNTQRSAAFNLTGFTKPGKVTNLNVSDNAAQSLLLTFDPPEGNVTQFMVVAVNDSDFLLSEKLVETNTNQPQQKVNVTNLPMGTRVTLRVAALAGNSSGDSVSISDYTAPKPISNLRLNTTSYSLTATWDPPVTNNLSFIVQLLLNDIPDGEEKVVKENGAYFDKLNTAAKYTVIVYSVMGNIRGDPVEGFMFTLPDPPTDARIVSEKTNKTHVTFVWKPPKKIENATYFVSVSSRFWRFRNSFYVNETNYTFTGLNSGTKYLFEVQTISDQILSQAANTTYVTDANKMEIGLSMLCSSPTSLLCDKDPTKDSVLKKLREIFNTLLEDGVTWNLEPGKATE